MPSRTKEHLSRGLMQAGSGSRHGAELGQPLGIFKPEEISQQEEAKWWDGGSTAKLLSTTLKALSSCTGF